MATQIDQDFPPQIADDDYWVPPPEYDFDTYAMEYDPPDDVSDPSPVQNSAAPASTPKAGAWADDTFWKARPFLEQIRESAYREINSPWAVLGAVLARVGASVPSNVVLGKTTKSHGSLNLLVALVGESGAGKDTAISLARDILPKTVEETPEFPVGSGAGIAAIFGEREKVGTHYVTVRTRENAIVKASEVSALEKLEGGGDNLQEQLRIAYSGDILGGQFKTRDRNLQIPAGEYRLSLVVGVQPKLSNALLNEKQAAGGTPQRLIWMNAHDAGASADAVNNLKISPLAWDPKQLLYKNRSIASYSGATIEIQVCDTAVKTVLDAQVAVQRREADALDTHSLFTRLKVAGILALLDNRFDIDDEDWSLSGVIMEHSNATREWCQRELDRPTGPTPASLVRCAPGDGPIRLKSPQGSAKTAVASTLLNSRGTVPLHLSQPKKG